MATSRPILVGDWLTDIRTGSPFIGSNIHATIHEVRRPQGYILQSDFGLDSQGGDAYWQLMRERVFGMTGDGDIHIAITNGTAPGLYVREGDDTSDWETYRQVLARRVEEAMAARRGVGGASHQETRLSLAGAAVSPLASRLPQPVVCVGSVDGMRLPIDNSASLADVRKVSSPSPQNVAANVSPMPDEEASRIEAAVSDEVRRRISSPLVSSSDGTTRQRVVNPVPPAPAVDVRLQFSGERETTASRIRQAVQRELDRLDGRIDAPSSPPPPPIPPPPPSRFSLLEVDLPPEPTSSTRRSLDVDLAALQEELRVGRERNRAQAAAQAQKNRFDLLECDLPPGDGATTPRNDTVPQTRPVALSPPLRRPVETITDLTAARSPLELAQMLEGLNDELSTMMRQREAN